MYDPDEAMTLNAVAGSLGVSTRHVQREIKNGRLEAVPRAGHARVTRLALWRYLGIEERMRALWLDHLARVAASCDGPKQSHMKQ